jgi:tRNA 2-thiouridine synthesizing protein A
MSSISYSDFPADAPLVLDLRELRCPMPLLKTRQQLRQLSPGQWLKVLASDPGSARDIPAWLRHTEHKLVQSAQQSNVFEFLILVQEEK